MPKWQVPYTLNNPVQQHHPHNLVVSIRRSREKYHLWSDDVQEPQDKVCIGQNRSPNLQQQQQQQKSNALILLGLRHSHHCMQAAMVVIVWEFSISCSNRIPSTWVHSRLLPQESSPSSKASKPFSTRLCSSTSSINSTGKRTDSRLKQLGNEACFECGSELLVAHFNNVSWH